MVEGAALVLFEFEEGGDFLCHYQLFGALLVWFLRLIKLLGGPAITGLVVEHLMATEFEAVEVMPLVGSAAGPYSSLLVFWFIILVVTISRRVIGSLSGHTNGVIIRCRNLPWTKSSEV